MRITRLVIAGLILLALLAATPQPTRSTSSPLPTPTSAPSPLPTPEPWPTPTGEPVLAVRLKSFGATSP